MPDKDGILKVFFGENDNVADVADLMLYDGAHRIRGEDLQDAPLEEIGWLGIGDAPDRLKKCYRDVCRLLSRKTDGKRDYLIIGIENQSGQDYGMVARVLLENVMNYAGQMRRFRQEHREISSCTNEQSITSKDFLSCMQPDDRLHPVVTIVIYWGTEPWKGPTSFRDLLEQCDPQIMELQPDFRMPILIPSRIPEEKLNGLSKNLKLVLKYAGASGNRKLLQRCLASDPDFCSAPPIVVNVLREVVGIHIAANTNNQGEVNMCKAEEEWMKESEERGIKLGEERGIKLGEERGIKLGEERGKSQARHAAIESLVLYERKQGISREDLCQMLMDVFLLDQAEALQYVAAGI